jgi:tetratricopeptide (TPR) repeat protein
MGLLLYRLNKFAQAFEMLFKGNGIIVHRIGYERYPFTSRYLYDLGLVYYDFGNYPKAKNYLIQSLRYSSISNIHTIECYNTLGLAYRKMEQLDSAAFYFSKAIAMAQNLRHSAWIGIASGNLGMIYYNQQKYDAAEPLLQADYHLSIQNKETASAAHTLCALADIHLLHHNYKAAGEALNQSLTFDEVQQDDRYLLHYTLTRARLCQALKQFECAAVLLDSAREMQSRITRRRDVILLAQIEKNMEVDKYLSEIKLMESEKSRELLIRNFIIIVTILLLMIAAQLIFKQQLKQKKNRELLNNAVYQLNSYIESLQEKNELIEQFKREIASMHAMPDYHIHLKEKEEISDKLKKYTIVTEEHWHEFRHLFEKVQKGFFETLKKKFPGLTQSEVRLMALMKLNLSRKEMAEMLGVSPDSIKKTRQRIRRKIELPEEMDLEGLVYSL